jgi:hypothetical protein
MFMGGKPNVKKSVMLQRSAHGSYSVNRSIALGTLLVDWMGPNMQLELYLLPSRVPGSIHHAIKKAVFVRNDPQYQSKVSTLVDGKTVSKNWHVYYKIVV